MLTVRKVPVPTTSTSVDALLDNIRTRPNNVGLQAPETNIQNIFFGDARDQSGELRPQANVVFHEVKPSEVYVRGTSGDFITVFLF